ncbi:MAG: hypothetical protein AAGJ31_07175, partial [Verrucomicrobiota bacterium]
MNPILTHRRAWLGSWPLSYLVMLSILLLPAAFSQDVENQPGDPTQASTEMEEVIRALRSSINKAASVLPSQTVSSGEITLVGLVVQGRQDPSQASGTAILRIGTGFVIIRKGQTLTHNGKKYTVVQLNTSLVVLQDQEGDQLVLRSQQMEPTFGQTYEIALLEMQSVPLHLFLRVFSDETGIRIAASSAARETLVDLYLRGVEAPEALDTLVLTHQLYMSAIPGAEIASIYTTQEYARDAGSFRDERTQVFTLKYPNARDVALSIRDLYGN